MDTVTGTASPKHWGAACEWQSCPGYNDHHGTIDERAFCSGHGVCNGTLGRCACGAGFTGAACATPISLVKDADVQKELWAKATAEADTLMATRPESALVVGKEWITWTMEINTVVASGQNATAEIVGNVQRGTAAYVNCDPTVLRAFHCGRVQHVDYVSANGSEVSTRTFEAETVVECVLEMSRDRRAEAAVLSTLETLAGTTMSSNKEREDLSRLIVSGGGVRGYTTTHVKLLALPVVRIEDKTKPEIVRDIVASRVHAPLVETVGRGCVICFGSTPHVWLVESAMQC